MRGRARRERRVHFFFIFFFASSSEVDLRGQHASNETAGEDATTITKQPWCVEESACEREREKERESGSVKAPFKSIFVFVFSGSSLAALTLSLSLSRARPPPISLFPLSLFPSPTAQERCISNSLWREREEKIHTQKTSAASFSSSPCSSCSFSSSFCSSEKEKNTHFFTNPSCRRRLPVDRRDKGRTRDPREEIRAGKGLICLFMFFFSASSSFPFALTSLLPSLSQNLSKVSPRRGRALRGGGLGPDGRGRRHRREGSGSRLPGRRGEEGAGGGSGGADGASLSGSFLFFSFFFFFFIFRSLSHFLLFSLPPPLRTSSPSSRRQP